MENRAVLEGEAIPEAQRLSARFSVAERRQAAAALTIEPRASAVGTPYFCRKMIYLRNPQ